MWRLFIRIGFALQRRDFSELAAQKNDQPPQLLDFFLLLYDNCAEIINRFLEIRIPDFQFFHALIHADPG